MGKYNIGGIKLEFNYCFPQYFEERIKQYQISDEAKTDYLINVSVENNLELPNSNLIINHKKKKVYRNNSKVTVCLFENDEIMSIVEYLDDYSLVNIIISQSYSGNSAEYEYIMSGLIFISIAMINNMLPIHASAINFNNQAVIFSAPSTTGKSTHANLWMKKWPEITIINDDKPIITFNDGEIRVVGTPWSGKTCLNNNISVPLRAIIFLQQSSNNYLEELDNKAKITHLMRNIQRPIESQEIDWVMEKINILINEIPMYLLHCNISEEAVDVVYQKIYQKE